MDPCVTRLAALKLIEDGSELRRVEKEKQGYRVEFSDNSEYLVFPTREDAEEYAKEHIKDMIDVEGLSVFSPNIVEDYIDYDKIAQTNRSYFIELERDNLEMLDEEELKRLIIDNELANENELEGKSKEELLEKYGDELAELIVDENIDEYVMNYVHNMSFDDLIEYIDIDGLVEEVLLIDGLARILASYDGNEIALLEDKGDHDKCLAYRVS